MSKEREAEMYPLVDSATYVTGFEDFEGLKKAVEAAPRELNMVQSWYLTRVEDEEAGETGRLFAVVLFMPAKGQTCHFETTGFEREEVLEWLDGYVRERVMSWYGWEGERE